MTGAAPKRLFFLYGGQKLPIIEMFDDADELTDDPSLAMWLVALLPNNWQLSARCAPHQIVLDKTH